MESINGTRYPDSSGKKAKIINRNFVVFAFFVVLSFLFWYLNSLEKDLEADIKYPVKYLNSPGNRELSEYLPSRLNLILKGPGYSILKLKISGNRSPLEVDISRTDTRHGNGKLADYYIVTSNLVQDFNSQLKSECKIVSVKPDTLFFPSEQDFK